jgi:FtsZ-binding cell division protein ZapB
MGENMGLFQRKNIDFSEQTASAQINPDDKSFHASSPTSHSSTKQPPKPSAPHSLAINEPLNVAKRSGSSSAEYGISDLVKLFHSLPQQNVNAEISTVVRTIASFNINIDHLIEDLIHQESLAKKRVKVLELEIELFKAKIMNRKKEMDLLQMGISELGKANNHLQHGLTAIRDENNVFSQRMLKKQVANLKKIPELNDPLPIAEKVRIAARKELEQVNSPGKIKSLRDRFKRRILKK